MRLSLRLWIPWLLGIVFAAGSLPVHGQDGETGTSPLRIAPADVRVEQTLEGGYYLIVRARAGLGSILLTESTEDPTIDASTYAYRNPEYHPENGDERRLLNGEFLNTPGLYSLIDSTPSTDSLFGQAFKLYIPYIVEYGYPWSRNGTVQVLDGTYLSIRAFEEPYGDYTGGFQDNPFILRVTQLPAAPVAVAAPPSLDSKPDPFVANAPPEPVAVQPDRGSGYMPDAVEEFERIAEDGGGEATWTPGEAGLIDRFREIVARTEGPSIDLVVALDTTQSMENDIPYLRSQLVPMLREQVAGRATLRVGMIFYRDYMEAYLTRRYEFQDDLSMVQRAVETIRVGGGRDIPEAVYEALYAAVTGFSWQAEERLVVLVGDAPPHPLPRGSVTREMVLEAAERENVRIHTVILPHDRAAAASHTALR
jgi:hypothetical protein